MFTPREKSPLTEDFEEGWTREAASPRIASPTYYQLSYSSPTLLLLLTGVSCSNGSSKSGIQCRKLSSDIWSTPCINAALNVSETTEIVFIATQIHSQSCTFLHVFTRKEREREGGRRQRGIEREFAGRKKDWVLHLWVVVQGPVKQLSPAWVTNSRTFRISLFTTETNCKPHLCL